MDTIVYDAVQDVKAVAEYNGGGIETLLNGRVVKSVQRGVYAGDTTNGTVAIPISEINSSKSVLLVNGVPEGDRCSLSNSSILCEEDGGRLAHFYLGWQVVEFY